MNCLYELHSIYGPKMNCYGAAKSHLARKWIAFPTPAEYEYEYLKEISQKRKSPTRLNPKSNDNQINWISNHLTTKSIDSQINRQPKSFESHISRQPNHLNLKSFDAQITWIPIKWQPFRSPESQIRAPAPTARPCPCRRPSVVTEGYPARGPRGPYWPCLCRRHLLLRRRKGRAPPTADPLTPWFLP